MSRPNFLLIFPDMWRGDCLSIANHHTVQTPYVDDIAARGVYFPGAYSSCPTCIPARVALATGLNSSNSGRLGYQDGVEWNYKDTMMHRLRDNGYQTIQVGKTHFYPQRARVGFEENILYEIPVRHNNFETDYHTWLKQETKGMVEDTARELDANTLEVNPWKYEEYLHPTAWTTRETIKAIERHDPQRPFFIQASYHRPHCPYDPPMAYWEEFKDKELPEPPIGDWCDEYKQKSFRINIQNIDMPKEKLDNMRRAYYANIKHVDHEIGKLFHHLNKNGYLDNTYVIIFSDHGDMLGDHYLRNKAVPFEGSARIPFVVYSPVLGPSSKGKINDAPVCHMDIMPTVLELAGVDSTYQTDGISLVKAINEEDNPRDYLHGEHSNPGRSGYQYIVNSKEKYCWETKSGKEFYFDLVKDKDELHNAINDEEYQEKIEFLRNKLIDILAQRPQDGLADGKKLICGTILPSVRPELLENAKTYI